MSSLSRKVQLLREKNAAKKIQRGVRTRRNEIFIKNPRNPLINYGTASRRARDDSISMNKSALLFSNLFNPHKQWGEQILPFIDTKTPLERAKIDLANIVANLPNLQEEQEEQEEYTTASVKIRGEEYDYAPFPRLHPRDFGKLVEVQEEEDQDSYGQNWYEFEFENVIIFVNAFDDSSLQGRLQEIYEILKPLVPPRRVIRRRTRR